MSRPVFYAVNKGHKIGVFRTWDECHSNVRGFAGAKYKKFTNQAEAEQFAGVRLQPYPSSSVITSSSIISVPIAKPSSSLRQNVPPIVLTRVESESDCDTVYSDGACKGNGMPGSVAGIGVWWGRNDPRNISERCPGAQTNNRAELIAIARVLETTPFGFKPLLIKTDSQYSRNCFDKWIHSWVKNGWVNSSKQPVKNKELIRYISALIDLRYDRGQNVHIQYVKGHSGDEGNDGADQLAVIGCQMPELPERDWDAERASVENPPSDVKKEGFEEDGLDWVAVSAGILSDGEFIKEWNENYKDM